MRTTHPMLVAFFTAGSFLLQPAIALSVSADGSNRTTVPVSFTQYSLSDKEVQVSIGALTASGAATPTVVLAARAPHLAATLYPTHTRISALDPLSNNAMDCDWGFACHVGEPITTAPVFHLRTQDDLHRVSGWAQFGDRRGSGPRMLFALYASRYSDDSSAGVPWNVLAFADFRGALMSQQYSDLNRVPQLLPKGVIGNTSAQLARSSDGDVYALSCWTGSIEVEGVVVYAHGSARQRTLARHDLARQVRAAVTAMAYPRAATGW